MKIALAMIVKDDSEVRILERCLDSIQNYVDGVYLTVTRPNQKEIEKLAKQRGLHLSEYKWDMGDVPWKNWDFSKARNFNFSQVPKGYDWILWCDSDDIWVGAEKIRDIAEKALQAEKDAIFFPYWYSCKFKGDPSFENLESIELEHLRERLLRPGKTEWHGRLHETFVPLAGIELRHTGAFYEENGIAVMHGITNKEDMERFKRNQTILELQLEEEGKDPDPRTLLYLMKIYGEMDDPEHLNKVIEYGQLYLEKSGWAEERQVACELIGNAYGKMGDNKKAGQWYLKSIGEWPHQPMVYLQLARSFYNQKRYSDAKYWLETGMNMKMSHHSTMMTNYSAMKTLASELLLKLSWNVDKDVKKALEAAKLLNSVNPNEQHSGNVDYLTDLNMLNDACGHLDHLIQYLEAIGENTKIVPLLNLLPAAFTSQPFAIKARQRNTEPKKWGKKEICYFANFGGPHFEKWDGNSLKTGIGGSETAVIRLSEEWTKLGYKVAVYGDPEQPCEINGVVYLPWYWFNPKDDFNIFIHWRGWGMAGKVKCKKFLVDMHDVFNGLNVGKKDLEHIDKFMVKSKYHRDLGIDIPDDKFVTISNGL